MTRTHFMLSICPLNQGEFSDSFLNDVDGLTLKVSGLSPMSAEGGVHSWSYEAHFLSTVTHSVSNSLLFSSI